jgi:hypothetical protein
MTWVYETFNTRLSGAQTEDRRVFAKELNQRSVGHARGSADIEHGLPYIPARIKQ